MPRRHRPLAERHKGRSSMMQSFESTENRSATAGAATSPRPSVSVVICAYNVAPYIRDSVDSALRQTYRDIEVLVVDDGSTDGGVEQLTEIDDPRLRVEKRPHSGHGPSLNAGIGLARGRYVGLLDADDRWLPEKLERHLACHTAHPAVDMTYSLSEEIDVDGVARGGIPGKNTCFISFRDLLVENVVRNGSAAVIRKDALIAAGPFDESLPSCQDLDMWLRIARLRERNIYALPDVLTQYRRRPRQVSSNVPVMQEGLSAVIGRAASIAPEDVVSTETERAVKSNCYHAYLSYEAGEFGDGFRFLWLGLRASPSRFLGGLKNWLFVAACLSGMVLPSGWHEGLDRWVRMRRRRSD